MHTPLHIEFARAQQAEVLARAAGRASTPESPPAPDPSPSRARRRPLVFWRTRPAQQPTR